MQQTGSNNKPSPTRFTIIMSRLAMLVFIVVLVMRLTKTYGYDAITEVMMEVHQREKQLKDILG
jgi:hypothetical protein